MKERVLKIIPDFFQYYLKEDVREYDSEDEFIVYTLEHELYLYENWKEEGYKDKDKEGVSYINKDNAKKIKRLISSYYKS